MKVVIDNKIPYINGAIEHIADEVVYADGRAFTPELIKEADALIIRTRTRCDRELLDGSTVQFIATATIGHDHIDADYCRRAGIIWKNTPGANANSVAGYIESCLVLMTKELKMPLTEMIMGVVGVGHVGSLICEKAASFGMKVLENDPPRETKEGKHRFVSLEEIAENCDVISFHTPLTMEGEHKTFHLADDKFFRSLKKRPVIINTSRGEVIHTQSLLGAINEGWVSEVVIDVWENEPHINSELLEKAYIATPHVAGYSGDGKGNATRMALEALCEHFKIKANFTIEVPLPLITEKMLATDNDDLILTAYNPMTDTCKLKADPDLFEEIRNNYPLRREVEVYSKARNDFFKSK